MTPEKVYMCYIYLIKYKVSLTNEGFIALSGQQFNNRLSSLARYITNNKAYQGWFEQVNDKWRIEGKR